VPARAVPIALTVRGRRLCPVPRSRTKPVMSPSRCSRSREPLCRTRERAELPGSGPASLRNGGLARREPRIGLSRPRPRVVKISSRRRGGRRRGLPRLRGARRPRSLVSRLGLCLRDRRARGGRLDEGGGSRSVHGGARIVAAACAVLADRPIPAYGKGGAGVEATGGWLEARSGSTPSCGLPVPTRSGGAIDGSTAGRLPAQ
jgi:hypothetical protein